MKPITLILLLAFSTPLLAQNDTLIINDDYKWKIGVKGFVESSSFFNDFKPTYFNYGIQGFYNISKNNNIETGIYYIKRLSNMHLLSKNMFNTSIESYDVTKLFIPLCFNKSVYLTKMYSLSLSVGGYWEYFLKDNFKLPENTFPPSHLYDMKSVFGLTYNVGLERNIRENLSFLISCGINNNISPLKSYDEELRFIEFSYFISISLLKKI